MQIVVNNQTGARFLQPNKLYREWARHAELQLRRQWRGQPLDSWLHVRALFFLPDKRRTDLSNLLEAPADALELAKVIDNDYRIVSWDGSRRLLDRDQPRIELTLMERPDEG